jgi:hypothetical protein
VVGRQPVTINGSTHQNNFRWILLLDLSVLKPFGNPVKLMLVAFEPLSMATPLQPRSQLWRKIRAAAYFTHPASENRITGPESDR